MSDEEKLENYILGKLNGQLGGRTIASHALEFIRTLEVNMRLAHARADLTRVLGEMHYHQEWVGDRVNQAIRLAKLALELEKNISPVPWAKDAGVEDSSHV